NAPAIRDFVEDALDGLVGGLWCSGTAPMSEPDGTGITTPLVPPSHSALHCGEIAAKALAKLTRCILACHTATAEGKIRGSIGGPSAADVCDIECDQALNRKIFRGGFSERCPACLLQGLGIPGDTIRETLRPLECASRETFCASPSG